MQLSMPNSKVFRSMRKPVKFDVVNSDEQRHEHFRSLSCHFFSVASGTHVIFHPLVPPPVRHGASFSPILHMRLGTRSQGL